MSLPVSAIVAIQKGRRGVHVVAAQTGDPHVYEAVGIAANGDQLLVETRHLNGEAGPTFNARALRALERTYEGDE